MKTKKFKVKQFPEIGRDWNSLMNKYCGKVVEFNKTRDIRDCSYCDTHPWAVYDEEVNDGGCSKKVG